MENKEKVSIIVAFYKSEPFIKKCIESIINQTYKNIEIILVNDGSPDNCGKICDEYANKDSRIVVIHKKNGGACEARNYGIDRTTGEYIVIVDGDDWLSNDYVEYMLNLVKEENCDMALSDSIFTTRDQKQNENDYKKIWTPEEAACQIIYPNFPIGPWNKIYRTSLIKNNNIRFDIPWSGEGLYFATMAAQYSNKVAVGHRRVYNYRLNNEGSGLTNYKVIMGINALSNIKLIGERSIIKTNRLKNAVNWHIWKNHNFLLKLIVATDSKEEYLKEYKECLVYLRKNMFDVIKYSEISTREKIRTVYTGLFPIFFAKRSLKIQARELKKDLENLKKENENEVVKENN